MAKMPKSVRVLGIDMPIFVRSPERDSHLDSLYGYADGPRGQIVISKKTAPHLRKETLLHELLHAAEHATRTDLPEETIGRMARCFYAIIRDNPALIAWIQETDA